jgi:hypothetical protein
VSDFLADISLTKSNERFNQLAIETHALQRSKALRPRFYQRVKCDQGNEITELISVSTPTASAWMMHKRQVPLSGKRPAKDRQKAVDAFPLKADS